MILARLGVRFCPAVAGFSFPSICFSNASALRRRSVTFRFASPANKVMTGPVERFKKMVHSPGFEPLIDYRSASYENLVIDGDNAVIDVILLGKDDLFIGYRFTLSRQRGGACVGCWMTDSVVPFTVEMS